MVLLDPVNQEANESDRLLGGHSNQPPTNNFQNDELDHDSNIEEVDLDVSERDAVTMKHGKVVKKPLLPNFTAMSKREVAYFSLRTSKIIIISVIFFVFGVLFSVFHEVPQEETIHHVPIGETFNRYIEMEHTSPLSILTIQVEIPVVSNPVLYRAKKNLLKDGKTEDWNLEFQLQRNSLLSNLDQVDEEHHFIDLANQTYVLPFFSHVKNQTEENNSTIIEADVEAISGSFTFYTDYNTLSHDVQQNTTYRLRISTNLPDNVTNTYVVKVNFQQQPDFARYNVIYAALVLLFVYVLIIFELIHRTIAGMVGSFVVLAVLAIVNQRPTLSEICEWMEYDTLALLFGMMIMVGIFSNTGFFEWSALLAYKLSKGKVWRLTVILCLFTAIVSAFLDNVTTILLVAPVTLRYVIIIVHEIYCGIDCVALLVCHPFQLLSVKSSYPMWEEQPLLLEIHQLLSLSIILESRHWVLVLQTFHCIWLHVQSLLQYLHSFPSV